MFFCEDCGAKNPLEPVGQDGQTIQVRCQACQYLNVVVIPKALRPDASRLRETVAAIVKPLTLFPGVMGSYVYHATDHQVIHDRALKAKDEVLLEIGAIAAKNFAIAAACFPDLTEQELALDKHVILCRRVAGAVYLLLVASPLPASSEFLLATNLALSKLLSCGLSAVNA